MDNQLPNIIDNRRVNLADTLKKLTPGYRSLSIATGFWDLPGWEIIAGQLDNYRSIRLLLGQEPRFNQNLLDSPDRNFPELDLTKDINRLDFKEKYQTIIRQLIEMQHQGRFAVKVYRGKFLHAKCYIFGEYDNRRAVGIIGSSNFTQAGLMANLELNTLEKSYQIVTYQPQSETQEHGHLSWFDDLWQNEASQDWNQKFKRLIGQSVNGPLTYSPYDMYIKTLMEYYEDEVSGPSENYDLINDHSKLYPFQKRNAVLLIKKLQRSHLAMLSDSVGLGKTATAGAVINYYLNQDSGFNAVVIAPPGLKNQWQDDLYEFHGLRESQFRFLSMHNLEKINETRQTLQKQSTGVDLFVIDESHNLRNYGGKKQQLILDWLADNPDSLVLLVTATPINNNLGDLKNQLQLAAKGKLELQQIIYPKDQSGAGDSVGFLESLKKLERTVKRNKQTGTGDNSLTEFQIRTIMDQGLAPYLVRATRQGVAETGQLLDQTGQPVEFPESSLINLSYQFDRKLNHQIDQVLADNQAVFEGHNPETIDSDYQPDIKTGHPLEMIKSQSQLETDRQNTCLKIYRVLSLFGFTAYRPLTYLKKYHHKTATEIKEAIGAISSSQQKNAERLSLFGQINLANLIRQNLLKRLESSPPAWKISLQKQQQKIRLFEDNLARGQILKVDDTNYAATEYGDELQLDDWPPESTEKTQIDTNLADYDLVALKRDLQRDRRLLDVLLQICRLLEDNDPKLTSLIPKLKKIIKAENKLIVFSYYQDTIQYLSQKLPGLIDQTGFKDQACFVTSQSGGSLKDIVDRFSPKSRQFRSISDGETREINYLFVTDKLSEGYNLQDCSSLMNFDLHWNPIRLIQRNGRINRLGSQHSKINIYNVHPEAGLEFFLGLVKKLEHKIQQIKATIGTDQTTLGESINPLEYVTDPDDLTDPSMIYRPTNQPLNQIYPDGEDQLLSHSYSIELKQFLDQARPEEIARIKKIAPGKWGYWPAKPDRTEDRGRFLGFFKGGQPNQQQPKCFIEADDQQITRLITPDAAFARLKTSPKDNQGLTDKIPDKELMKTRMVSHVEDLDWQPAGNRPYDKRLITPEVLEALGNNNPDIDWIKGLARADSRQLTDQIRKLARQARYQLEDGRIEPETQRALEEIIQPLIADDRQAGQKMKPVLFYARQ